MGHIKAQDPSPHTSERTAKDWNIQSFNQIVLLINAIASLQNAEILVHQKLSTITIALGRSLNN